MRIIQIITLGHRLYGAQNHVLQLSRRLREEGHDVLVLVGSVGDLTEELDAAGIAWKHVATLVRPIRPWTDFKAVNQLVAEIKGFSADLVTTHSSKAGIVGRVAAWRCGVPSIFTAHGWSFAEGIPARRKRIALLLERLVGRYGKRIICVAEAEREYGIQQRVAPAEKLVTIHYGIEDKAEHYLPRANSHDQVKMAMVAGFREQKDHATLIEALAKIQHLPWEISFLGDGELRAEMEKKVNACGLQQRIHFAGMVNNVSDYFRKIDLLVLITNWEGLPISTLEGLSFSLPVVASRVAGTCEQVVDGRNGITVARGDVDEVATAIEAMVTDPEKRTLYGRESRRLFEERFTIDAMYRKTVALYQEVVAESRQSRKD